MGRQKIKIVKIEIKNHLQVTFSKRRSGLFKKASELATLCGVQMAIIVFSPGGKVFSFGHPNLEPIIGKFLNRSQRANLVLQLSVEALQSDSTIWNLDLQLAQISSELEAERNRCLIFDHMRKDGSKMDWWRGNIDNLGFNELEQLRVSLEELKRNVVNQANKHLVEAEAEHLSFSTSFQRKPNQIIDFSAYPQVNNLGYGQGFF